MICWLQITSGRGPAECCWVVTQAVRRIMEEAAEQSLKVRILEAISGEKPSTHKSALLALEGERFSEFVRQWTGTVQWVGKSPFRPHHKRKNWFIGVDQLKLPESRLWSEKDIRIETMRASGPGGQHLNKTETAVRVTLVPAGLSTVAQEERSQHLNRKLALARLAELVRQEENREKLRNQQERWSQHNRLERGNPVRVYEGKRFRLRNRI
ncbi:MAG: peptide chain release factor H [Deltaproteobacteria bacterium]|nr:MAG: peptide chain release factor H [Deltaproteobacteria bacterium]